MATHARSIEDVRPQNFGAPSMNRRAALGAIAAGALVAAPRAAQAADLDADLFALAPAIEAADRELDAALAALRIAEDEAMRRATVKPAAPPMDRESEDAIEAFGRRMKEIRARGTSPEQAAHDEALRRWEADKERVRAESGMDAADEAEGEALEAVMDLQTRIAETPARTLAGLVFKARYAAERDNDPVVMESIIDDLLALAGEA